MSGAHRSCVLCGSERVRDDRDWCAQCRKDISPTPLDEVLRALGMSEHEFAAAYELPVRTVIRAASGERMSARVAERLADLTGLPPETFRP